MIVYIVLFIEDDWNDNNDWIVDEVFYSYNQALQYGRDKKKYYKSIGYENADFEIVERGVK